MMRGLKSTLIEEAKNIIKEDDPSHDLDHALRVLANAEYIAQFEGGDLDIIIPATLFHDAVNYPKNDPKARHACEDSAKICKKILNEFEEYDHDKIKKVERAILEHSFSRGIKPKYLESMIVQDADRLEATGAISIMRTFCSSGQMKRKFYDSKNLFCKKREPGDYAIDLFYKRLLKVKDLMNTHTARKMAEKRTRFLYDFLDQLNEEIM